MTRHWAAVIGDPVAHSLSPRIFHAWRDATKRKLHYWAVKVPAAALAQAVKSARERSWAGWNVTLPHKVAIMAELDSLDASAKAAGAVNVVRFQKGGCTGFNTDVDGFLAPLSKMRFPLKGRNAVVLGAGGAARAVCAALRKASIGDCLVLSRNPARAEVLTDVFGVRCDSMDSNVVEKAVSDADIVVNATPLGLDGITSPLAPGLRWKRDALAYDLVYRPLRTPFLEHAEEAGVARLGGLPMLVAQAAASWRLWFGEDVPAPAVAAVEQELTGALQ